MSKIQTAYGGNWIDCEHKNWEEVIADGWIFLGLDKIGNVMMTRKGCLNMFRNNPKVTK